MLLLGTLGNAARPALPDLFRVFRKTDDTYFRRSIVEAIAAIGGAAGDGFLPEALGDKSVIVRSATVAAISGKLHRLHPDAQEGVIQALLRTAERDASQSVRDAARSAMEALNQQRQP
ncbi:MAG: HEAT repeat domain-containing protein [Bacillota bacterium]